MRGGWGSESRVPLPTSRRDPRDARQESQGYRRGSDLLGVSREKGKDIYYIGIICPFSLLTATKRRGDVGNIPCWLMAVERLWLLMVSARKSQVESKDCLHGSRAPA